jgi:hypothetical protein
MKEVSLAHISSGISTRADLKITVDGETFILNLKAVAKWLAHLDADLQARFLSAVAKEMNKDGLDLHARTYTLGGHLRHCGCATEDARELVRTLAYWTEHSDQGKPVKDQHGGFGYSAEPAGFLKDLLEFRRLKVVDSQPK